MIARIERRLAFAETCRSHAAKTSFPFQRDILLEIARLSEQEAELVRLSRDCIAQRKNLIAQAEILLRQR